MIIFEYQIPESVEQEVRMELVKSLRDGVPGIRATEVHNLLGTVIYRPKETDPKKIAEEILHMKEILRAVFEIS